MTIYTKTGVELVMPPKSEETERYKIEAAEFIARMIRKYGKQILEKKAAAAGLQGTDGEPSRP